ncbi:hypothetical protein NL676_014392 [Syzygium grande]|nr:hypothetical protein NL676_014392 [Syzygium grande]
MSRRLGGGWVATGKTSARPWPSVDLAVTQLVDNEVDRRPRPDLGEAERPRHGCRSTSPSPNWATMRSTRGYGQATHGLAGHGSKPVDLAQIWGGRVASPWPPVDLAIAQI